MELSSIESFDRDCSSVWDYSFGYRTNKANSRGFDFHSKCVGAPVFYSKERVEAKPSSKNKRIADTLFL
jgi:hypothetical protein